MMIASGTNAWDKETAIRRRISNIFNKREEDFPSLKEYNDYLEEVEDMTVNLIQGIDVSAIEAKIAKYEEENVPVRYIQGIDVPAEELTAALRISQNFGHADPADVGAGPSTQAVGVANQEQRTPAAVPSGLVQLFTTGMAPHPVPIGAPSDPMQGYAAKEEETMKLQAEREANAGG